MDIKKHNNEIIINSNITTYDDYQVIKDNIHEIINSGIKDIIIKTPESFSITSSIIGFFIKIIFQDRVTLSVYVKDENLYSLLEDLNLIETFKVKKY